MQGRNSISIYNEYLISKHLIQPVQQYVDQIRDKQNLSKLDEFQGNVCEFNDIDKVTRLNLHRLI